MFERAACGRSLIHWRPRRAPRLHRSTLRDDLGATTSRISAAPPQRIVSLLPSLTETLCELGACTRLVGVDRYLQLPRPA